MVKKRKKELLDISTPKDALITLAIIGGMIAAVSLTPAILAPAILLKAMSDKKRREKYIKSAHYLKRNGLVRFSSNNKTLTLTQKGNKRALLLILKKYTKERSKKQKWDKIWRVLTYDIPASERNKRDAVRNMIKQIGMVHLQKSVWVCPFDCDREIDLLRKYYDLNDDKMRLMLVSSLGDDKKLRKFFRL